MIDPVLATVLRLGVATLLLLAAWHKLRDVRAFRAAIAGYALVPGRAVPVVAMLVVGAEIVLGISLLLPRLGAAAAVGSAALLALYTTAIAVNLSRGRTRIDCGCAGPSGALPLSRALVARNGVLIILSVGAAWPTSARALQVTDLFTVCVATLTFACLYVATETALANAARWRHAAMWSAPAEGRNA